MVEGKLFYVIGPSGSGKDSLMRYGRERLAADPGVVFAHRYITRPVELHGENHVTLTETEFDARLAAGLFAMHWESHGLRYGIGWEINLWLAKGCNVVMNGSREYLPEARRRYPGLTAILVTVSPEVLAARLLARGRETEDQISRRIARAKQFMHPEGRLEVIENDAELHVAGERLVLLCRSPTLPNERLPDMRVTFLGTGAAGGVPLYGCDCPACTRARAVVDFRRRPCTALIEAGDTRILLDAGLTDLTERFPPGSLSAIVLTHFHPDHVQGLFHLRWGIGKNIPVYGPPDSEGCADLYKNQGLLEFRRLTKFEPVTIGNLVLTPLPLIHSKATFGYAIEDTDGQRFAYLTDTAGLPPRTEAFLKNWRPASFALDCSYPPQSDLPRNHNDLTLALTIAETLAPARVWLTHVSHELDAWLLKNIGDLPPHMAVAYDSQVVSDAGFLQQW